MILRHWTAAERIPHILAAGRINPTESNVSMTEAHAGPDVVWLMPPDVDPGEGKAHGLHDAKRTGWIDVDVPAIRWVDWIWTARMTPDWRAAFLGYAGGEEVAQHWYVFPGPIRVARFVSHGTREA